MRFATAPGLRWLLAFASLVVGVAVSASVRAQETPARRTAVLRLEFDGKVSEVVRDNLQSHLGDSLAAAGFQVFSAEGPVKEMLKARPELANCVKPECFREICSILGADYLVLGHIESRQKNYDLQLELIGGRTGERLAATHEKCELCGIREASEQMDAAASGLKPGLDRAEAPTSFSFESDPPNALVVIDGRPVGFTPLTWALPAGRHEAELSAEGYIPQKRTFEIQTGRGGSMKVELEPTPVRGGGLPPPRRAWGTIGWVGVAVGLAVMGAGAYVLSLDGNVIDGQACPPEKPECEAVRNTMWGGAALAAGGAAVFGAGAFSLYVSHVAGSRGRSVAQAPTTGDPPGGNEVGLGGGWMLFSRGTF